MIKDKKISISNTLLILFVITLIINYLVLENLSDSYFQKDMSKINNEVIKNTKNMNKNDLDNLSYEELNSLANTYYARGDLEKSKEITLIILNKFNSMDKNAINLLIAICDRQMNFDECIKYGNLLVPQIKGDSLVYLYIQLSDFYLTKDIELSLDHLNKAVRLLEGDENLLKNEKTRESIKYKLDFLTNLKNDSKSKNPIKYYSSILSDRKFFISDNVKKFLYEEYKDKYSKLYPSDFKELDKIYNKNVKPYLD